MGVVGVDGSRWESPVSVGASGSARSEVMRPEWVTGDLCGSRGGGRAGVEGRSPHDASQLRPVGVYMLDERDGRKERKTLVGFV